MLLKEDTQLFSQNIPSLPGRAASLRLLWAESVLFQKNVSLEGIEKEFLTNPIDIALFHLLQKEEKDLHVVLTQSSLDELCQFACIYGIIDPIRGKEFAKRVLSFSFFPTFRSLESSYDEERTKLSVSLLHRAFGKKEALADDLDLYFAALCHLLPCFEETWKDPILDAQIFDDVVFDLEKEISSSHPSFCRAAFVTEGEGMSLGVLVAKEVEIVALGPQVSSLNEPQLFGMDRIVSSRRWGRVHAQKDVWFEVESDLTQGSLDIRFYGNPQSLFFVFYLRADQVMIDSKTYLPKTLDRYQGQGFPVILRRKNTEVVLKEMRSSTTYLIPLAGEGCFWGADFLLAFQVQERLQFQFSAIDDLHMKCSM